MGTTSKATREGNLKTFVVYSPPPHPKAIANKNEHIIHASVLAFLSLPPKVLHGIFRWKINEVGHRIHFVESIVGRHEYSFTCDI